MPTKSVIQSMDEALEGFVMVELVITGTIFAIGGGLFYLMHKGTWDRIEMMYRRTLGKRPFYFASVRRDFLCGGFKDFLRYIFGRPEIPNICRAIG